MLKTILGIALCIAMFIPLTVSAQLSGAIFTTLPDGSEVNYNIYSDKNDVYLDGGPGPGAPQTAAGLPDGRYVFQVTDPSGKTLLSTDAVQCREFDVAAGIITGVAGPCPHAFGADVDHGATTVQLMPYNDTPNPGGEYKVWVEKLATWPSQCALSNVDCTLRGTFHGFKPSLSKTDNYKVGSSPRELDTRFFFDANGDGFKNADETWIDGLEITWHDTLGNSNNKWSYLNTTLDINHEAHVEDVETGTHLIDVYSQTGCNVGNVFLNGSALKNKGPQTVSVSVKNSFVSGTLRIDVACEP
jgi:hypothetical protein